MTRTYEELIYIINQYIKENNNKEITGDILNNVLNQISLYAKENTDELLRLIDEIETGSYELPEATTSVLGGVMIDGETIVKDLSGRIKAVLDTSNLATKTDIESINTTLTNKVDVVNGKGLSTNDYTTTEKTKLSGLSNYTLPSASTSIRGGVKVDGTTITIANDVISAKTQDINISSISTTDTAEQLNALADGLYFANGAGIYSISISNPTTGVTVANGKTTVAEGYNVSFNKKGSVWSLASAVKIDLPNNILSEEDLTLINSGGVILSTNRLNREYIKTSKTIGSTGAVTDSSGGNHIIENHPISSYVGKNITFNGYLPETLKKIVFNTIDGTVIFPVISLTTAPITVKVPVDAAVFSMTIKRTTETGTAVYDELRFNEGTESLPYEPYGDSSAVQVVKAIKGYELYNDNKAEAYDQKLNTTDNVKFNSVTTNQLIYSAIQMSLPIGAGAAPTEVKVGDAWIDSNAGNVVKVRTV